MKLVKNNTYILLIDEEAEINTLDAVINLHNNELHFALEECLHKDNNCKKVTAHYPLTKEAEEIDLPLLPNPIRSGNEVIDWIDKRLLDFENMPIYKGNNEYNSIIRIKKMLQRQSKQFSLDDIKKAIEMARRGICSEGEFDLNALYGLDDLQEVNHKYSDTEIIQSLSTQQLPKEFILGKGDNIEEQIKNGHYEY